MKRSIFSLLMIICSVSRADWEITAKASGITFYHDKSSIRERGTVTTMWIMIDHPTTQQLESVGNYRSEMALRGFNCNSEMYTVINIVLYPEPSGRGRVVFSVNHDEEKLNRLWAPIVPRSTSEAEWKIACRKK
jgi:hypothetical protein